MSFLAPLFLLGALAVTLPIVFHLLRRSSRNRQPFSSLMFLRASPPRANERSRLENILLLILRCLVIALLSLAFARPFIPKSVEASRDGKAGKNIVILLDTSASMGRGSLWDEARRKVDQIVSRVSVRDRVGFLTYDSTVQRVVSLKEWAELPVDRRKARVRQAMGNLEPSYESTHLGKALIHASEYLEAAIRSVGEETAPRPREVKVISDFQKGSALGRIQGYTWPEGLTFELEPVGEEPETNATLEWLPRDTVFDRGAKTGARLRVYNAEVSNRDQFRLAWADSGASEAESVKEQVGRQEIYVPAGEARTIEFPFAETDFISGQVALSGDDIGFDNRLYVTRRQRKEVPVIYLGDGSQSDPESPLYYLARALGGISKYDILLKQQSHVDAIPESVLSESDLMLVSKVLSDSGAEAIQKWVDEGGTVLLLCQEPAMANGLGRLMGRPALSAQEVVLEDYALLGEIDFNHPLFAPFAKPRFNDFTKIHFWRYRKLDPGELPGSKVLARFDTGDPALMEVGGANPGAGVIFVLTSGWQPRDSQYARSSKFVPWLYSLLQHAGSIREEALQLYVGETVRPASDGETEMIPISRNPGADSDQQAFVPVANGIRAVRPGLYRVRTGANQERRVAVNIAPEEGRTTPLAPDQLEQLGVPIGELSEQKSKVVTTDRERYLKRQELERRQAIWRWLILLALVLVLVETWVAGRLTKPTTE